MGEEDRNPKYPLFFTHKKHNTYWFVDIKLEYIKLEMDYSKWNKLDDFYSSSDEEIISPFPSRNALKSVEGTGQLISVPWDTHCGKRL